MIIKGGVRRLGLFQQLLQAHWLDTNPTKPLNVENALELSNRTVNVHVTKARPGLNIRKPPLAEERIFQVKDHLKPITDHDLFYFECSVFERHGKEYIVPRVPDNRHLRPIRFAVVNMMMQGRERKGGKGGFNNAYQLEESNFEYQARVKLFIKRLAHLLQSAVDILLLEEAPIGEDIEFAKSCFREYSSDTFEADLSGTEWGIMLVVNKQKFPDLLPTMTVSNEGPMKHRLASVTIPALHVKIYNLHVPHGKYCDDAVRVIEEHLALNTKNSIQKGEEKFTQIFAGDWNSAPNITAIPQRVLDQVLPLKHQDVAYVCDIVCVCNDDGHTDASGQELTVDYVLMMVLDFCTKSSLQNAQLAVANLEVPSAASFNHRFSNDFRPRP